jgi:hypothetical protein
LEKSGERSAEVIRAHDDSADFPVDPDWMEELRELLPRLCDDQLTLDDRPRLNQLLDEHAAARAYYLKYMAVHSSLAAMAGSASAADAQLTVERMTLARFAGQTSDRLLTSCSLEPARSDFVSRRQHAALWVAGISALVLIAFGTWSLNPNDQESVIRNDVALITTIDVEAEPAVTGPLVAEVTYVSSFADWQNPNGSFAVASRVRAGQTLTLIRGQVELTYGTGAKLLLTGPSEFLVRTTGGELRRGELVARVPEAGHGFTIETPHGKVIDLGTEFGVVVDDFGVSQVSVFEGKVETLPTGTTGKAEDKIELTSGRAIQWTKNSIIPISVQGRRYTRSDDDAATNAAISSDARVLVDASFGGRTFERANWRVLGDAVASEAGLRLQSVTGQRPYLLTTDELNPADGAVTVACDLVFETVFDAENASFAVLTRSADQHSKPGMPWSDMLARSVRCRLMADLLSGEGMLEAGTKYEADREHTNISWGGFSQPRPGTRYRLEMRDDGLNVSFTVSLVDNPAVRKTITCRSLFRGNQNFVALEGPSTGAVLVERLMIAQDVAPSSNDQMLALATTSKSSDAESSHRAVSKRLDQLAPANAELIARDTFDGATLDSGAWRILGDVVLDNGALQLGLPNQDGHIDTWKARPYLLSREQFNPADGALTVLGQVKFAENFLHGYGGSFAVMTRADDTHGGGPAWENSILRRGVRSNFWPAAYGFDHSLEIHEKPEPNTISLLVAQGFPIVPTSRTYLFKIVDDGHAAELTFIDAADPEIRKTVSHITSSSMLRSGHVAFEGCWGSPMRLDEVRIYRGK